MHPVRLLIVLCCGLFYTYACAGNTEELRMGSVANDIPTVMHQRLQPLAEYLSQELHQPVVLQLSSDMASAIKEIVNQHVQISYLTPVAYLQAHQLGQARLVAKCVTDGKSSFQLMIVVRQDSPIKQLNELAGKSFAFGDPAAKLQKSVVALSGVKIDKFSEIRYLGHYDNIARGVLSGDFDAGILKDTDAIKWEGKGLRIIYSSPALPPYNIVVNREVSEALSAQIKAAFLKLDRNNPHHMTVIQSLDKEYTGFAPTSDAEYDIIRKMIKLVDTPRPSP